MKQRLEALLVFGIAIAIVMPMQLFASFIISSILLFLEGLMKLSLLASALLFNQ